MLFAATLALASAALVVADVVPTGPTPGDVFREGGNCLIQYDVDTTGAWGNTTIDLMSGSNLNMSQVANVVSGLDGATGGVINWECPDVTPNANIYFYQYSAPGQQVTWTGRFTIAGAGGEVTQPTESEVSNGQTIRFGYGALTNPSESVAAPSISGGAVGAGGANSTSSAASSTSASSSISSAASSASSMASSAQSSATSMVRSVSSAAHSAATSAASAVQSARPTSGAGALVVSGGVSALAGVVAFALF